MKVYPQQNRVRTSDTGYQLVIFKFLINVAQRIKRDRQKPRPLTHAVVRLVPLFPKAKFVLVSGLFDEKLSEAARAAGFDALMPKPFAMPTITQKIEDLLGLKQKENLVDMVKRTSQLPSVKR